MIRPIIHIAVFLMLLTGALSVTSCSAQTDTGKDKQDPRVVETGLDVLVGQNFSSLEGGKIGVVTNHTGVDSQGRPLYILLDSSPLVELAAVFAPEHGLEGLIGGEYESGRLSSGLTVYSLYGENRKPKQEWLEELDALVFDIQDIGTRFYTYITTMALCMQAATEAGIRFYVLDRPNPVGGIAVEGPVLEKSLHGNFIAYYPIPVRHGMTVGELAMMFNTEFGIGVELKVIQMKSWRRGMYYDHTGLTWIDPSPNMRSLSAAILYPGLGISEATNLSVGRGTDIPFELYGAPYVDGSKLAQRLNEVGLAGVTFRDTSFTPLSHVFPNQICGGVRAVVTDRDQFNSVEAGLHLLDALERLYPDHFELDKIDRWIGRKDVKHKLEDGVAVAEIIAGWQGELEQFKQIRANYLIYHE